MSRTFEEIAGSELDALYQGALFLSGGHRPHAERLLVAAMTAAYHDHAFEPVAPPFEPWLEGVLVRTFLSDGRGYAAGEVADQVDGPEPSSPHAAGRFGAAALYRGARSLPARARAALWLVLLRRWRYERAAEAVGVDRERFVELLGYRDAFMTEVLSANPRDGIRSERNRA